MVKASQRIGKDDSVQASAKRNGLFKGGRAGGLALILTASICSLCALAPRERQNPARLTVWSWDYPQDLTFIKSGTADIAYYAGTMYLHQGRLFFQERSKYKPLKISSGVKAYPVIRIETEGKAGHLQNQDEIVAGISRAVLSQEKLQIERADMPQKIQIDFDAREDERSFYQALLKDLRGKLSRDTRLEITALASWCTGESFIKDELCDRQIPMLFSMGVDKKESKKTRSILAHIDKSRYKTIGISINEPKTNQAVKESGLVANSTDLYLFSSTPWTKESWKKIQQELVSK